MEQQQQNIDKKPIFTQDEVHFWKPVSINGEFSNFYSSPFTLKGKVWPTAEHYFQAQKFAGTEKEEIIRQLTTPAQTFQLGRKRDTKFPIRQNWDQIKENIMYECCFAKYSQNQSLKNFLLNTGDAKIVEASPRDFYWGWGRTKKGKNRLGFILMKIREELKKMLKKKSKIKNYKKIYRIKRKNKQNSNPQKLLNRKFKKKVCKKQKLLKMKNEMFYENKNKII